MNFLSVVESQTFLLFCFIIFAIAFFTYLNTAMILCQRNEFTQKKKKVPAPKVVVCKYDNLTENWLLTTELQQSPINIETYTKVYALPPINWVNHDLMPKKMVLENNGETMVLHALFDGLEASINGAGLENSYNFVNISFRWGTDSSFGADHMLNFQTYPLEMQVMYYLGAVGSELSSRKLLIIAFLYEIGDFSEQLELILSNTPAIRQAGYGIKIEPFPLGALCPLCSGGFYCYIGTMTMPPFYEGIKWFVYSKIFSLNLAQLKEFYKLLGPDMKPVTQVKRLAQSL